jgi:hypothetical protein
LNQSSQHACHLEGLSFLMVSTFKTLSSNYSEIYNALLLTISMLPCQNTRPYSSYWLQCPTHWASSSIPSSLSSPASDNHYTPSLYMIRLFRFHIWMKSCSVCLSVPGITYLMFYHINLSFSRMKLKGPSSFYLWKYQADINLERFIYFSMSFWYNVNTLSV